MKIDPKLITKGEPLTPAEKAAYALSDQLEREREREEWNRLHPKRAEIEWGEGDLDIYFSVHNSEDPDEERETHHVGFAWSPLDMADRFELAAAWLRDMTRKYGDPLIIDAHTDN